MKKTSIYFFILFNLLINFPAFADDNIFNDLNNINNDFALTINKNNDICAELNETIGNKYNTRLTAQGLSNCYQEFNACNDTENQEQCLNIVKAKYTDSLINKRIELNYISAIQKNINNQKQRIQAKQDRQEALNFLRQFSAFGIIK